MLPHSINTLEMIEIGAVWCQPTIAKLDLYCFSNHIQNITCRHAQCTWLFQFLWSALPQYYPVGNDKRHFDRKTELGVWSYDGQTGWDNMQGLTRWLSVHLIRWCKLNTSSRPKSHCALSICFIIIITLHPSTEWYAGVVSEDTMPFAV